MTSETKDELSKNIGEKALRIMEREIGLVEKPSRETPEVHPIFRFEAAWGSSLRPKYRCDIENRRSSDVSCLSNSCTVNKKFFWPNMANENIDGRHRRQPMVLQLPSSVRDLRGWLGLYGEPDPGRLPNGSMTTFTASRRRVGREKSQASAMTRKGDGAAWHSQYAARMAAHYGPRFRPASPAFAGPPAGQDGGR